MATDFARSLKELRDEYERQESAFRSSWKDARQMLSGVFAEAQTALDNAQVGHENGNSSTLTWRGAQLSFKADSHRRKIVRSCSTGAPEELYDLALLTRGKVEEEVRDFVRSVLGLEEDKPKLWAL